MPGCQVKPASLAHAAQQAVHGLVDGAISAQCHDQPELV
jgi:hypothetical protein